MVLGLAGALIFVAFRRGDSTAQELALVPLFVALALVVVLDARCHVIPDAITLPALAYALLRSAVLGTPAIGEALLGVIVAGGGLLVVAALSRGGIGGGDVKLLAVVGAATGWKSALIALALAQVGGVLVVIALSLIHGRLARSPIPIGAFIALAGALLLV
jgi:leader peptidase (prepilin peptidase) / N-methyltransferase